jgi:hypothetical protein
MSSFTVFVDESPSRARIPSIPFTFTTLTPPLSPSIDKENVNPRGGRVASGPTKAKKRRYVREEGAGPLAAKRKAKALASAAATTAAASGSSSTARKSEKKPRRALLGKSNSSSGSSSSASTPLSTTPTLIEEALMDRRVFELTVSPLADASEAYIGTNLTPLIESCTLTEVCFFAISWRRSICSIYLSGYISLSQSCRCDGLLLLGISPFHTREKSKRFSARH